MKRREFIALLGGAALIDHARRRVQPFARAFRAPWEARNQ